MLVSRYGERGTLELRPLGVQDLGGKGATLNRAGPEITEVRSEPCIFRALFKWSSPSKCPEAANHEIKGSSTAEGPKHFLETELGTSGVETRNLSGLGT